MKKRRKAVLILLAAAVTVAAGLTAAHAARPMLLEWLYEYQSHTDAEAAVMAYAQENDVSYGQYPPELIELLERNPETEAFVLEYPQAKDQEYEIDLSEYDRSEGVPLLLQWDRRWGYAEYGDGIIGLTGCGPVCLSMAGYYVTGDTSLTPEAVAAFAEENGYYSSGNGSKWTLISEGGTQLGLDVTQIPLLESRIMDNLAVDNPIICAVGPGDFTTTGHYIVLVGEEDGLISVNDPNSRKNSEKLWSYEQLESQIRNLWVIRAGG